MDWELWGTFSVGDHLRRRPFVADVLLYDRLIVPTPPDSDTDEQKRWRTMGWKPHRQKRILDLIASENLIRVPWTEGHRLNWEGRYRDALKEQRKGFERAAVRSELARAAAADVSRTMKARKSFDWVGHKNRGGQPEEVDQLAHFTTREFLVDWSNEQNDTELFMGLPKVEVDSVSAYGSYSAFSMDHQIETTDIETGPSSDLLNLFGWEFLVPNDTKRPDEDLLKQALELANLEETKLHRRIFHKWRREMALSGKAPQEVVEEMEDVTQNYRSAVRKTKIATSAKYAFAAITAGLGAGALFAPVLGAAGAFAGFGSFVVSELAQGKIPEKLKVAAMFHDARMRFGWYRFMRRRRCAK